MPTIIRLSNCVVTMYAADHLPPHFHIRWSDGREALVEIETMAVLSGTISRRELAPALKWASANKSVLDTKWRTLNP
jgi:hypothetical protein